MSDSSPDEIPVVFDVFFDVQPKGDEEVDDDGRAKRGEGKVDEIHANPGRSEAHFVAQIAANAEGGAFHQIFERFHVANIARFYQKRKGKCWI